MVEQAYRTDNFYTEQQAPDPGAPIIRPRMPLPKGEVTITLTSSRGGAFHVDVHYRDGSNVGERSFYLPADQYRCMGVDEIVVTKGFADAFKDAMQKKSVRT